MAIRSPITTMPVFGGNTNTPTTTTDIAANPAPAAPIYNSPSPTFNSPFSPSASNGLFSNNNVYTASNGSQFFTNSGAGSLSSTVIPQPAFTPAGGTSTQQSSGGRIAFNPTNPTSGQVGGASTQQQGGRVTPTVNPATFSTAQGNVYAPPSVPTFAPSTYVNTPVTGMTGTFNQPTLDSYLRSSVQSLFSPSSIENGTAMRDPTQMLTSLANNYLALNPGAGSQADIQNLVNQYAKQYTDWYGQYDQYLKNENGKIALPSGSPYAQAAGQQLNQPVSTPQTNTTGMTNNTQTQNTVNSMQQFLQQFLGQMMGQPQYHSVKTPLGYTQYQSNVPQTSQNGVDPMTQLILSMLMGQGGGRGGSQGSFWNLLGGQGSGAGGGMSNNNSGMVFDPQTGNMVFAPNGLNAYHSNLSSGLPGSF